MGLLCLNGLASLNIVKLSTMKKQRLSIRQERFCHEILKDYVASYAAERAGYAKGSAKQRGYVLMNTPYVQDRIAELQAEQSGSQDFGVADVVDTIKQVAFDVTAKNMDRLRAAELLGKHLNMFTDRSEVVTKSSGMAVRIVQFDGTIVKAGHVDPHES